MKNSPLEDEHQTVEQIHVWAKYGQKMRKIGGLDRLLRVSIKIHQIIKRDGHRHPSSADWHM